MSLKPTYHSDTKEQLVNVDPHDLPEELVLILFKLMKPGDILSASQTCQLWRIVGENDNLWEQKCKEAGLDFILTPANKRALERRNENSPIAYSAWKESFLKPYKIPRKLRKGVPQISTIEMSHSVNKMEFFNDKIVTIFGTNLYVFCASAGEILHELVGHTKYVAEVQMDEKFIVSGSHDGSLKVWDVDTGSCVHTMKTGAVTFLQMHGNIAVSVSIDGISSLQVWDVREGRIRNSVCTWSNNSYIRFLKFNGVNVVVGYDDDSVTVWDVIMGICRSRRTLRVNWSQYMELLDNTLVCAGNDRTTAQIWNMSTGACLITLDGHRRAITGIALNDKLVVTSSRDGMVKLWDVKTGEFIRNLLVLEAGETVEKMKMDGAKIVCVVKSKEGLKLLVLNFDTIDSD